MADVFISYSRKDSEFVRKLHSELVKRERDAWVDWKDIPPTAEWMKEIFAAVVQTKAFLLIISPDSIASKVVSQELEHAFSQNKRIIPLLYRDVDASSVPERLAKLNWILLRDSDNFAQGVGQILSAIDTDLDWLRAHTRLLVRTVEWDSRTHDKSLLLRGADLSQIEDWLSKNNLSPAPTTLQTQFVTRSRKAATARQRIVLSAVTGGLLVAVALAVVALLQRREAERQATIAFSRQLAANAQQELPTNPDLAILLAVEAATLRPTELTEQVLREVVNGSRIRAVLKGYRFGVNGQTLSANGRFVVRQDHQAVHIWDIDEAAAVQQLADCPADISTVSFSPSQDLIATGHQNGRIRIWNVTNGAKEKELLTDSQAITNMAFDSAGRFVAALSANGITRVWSLPGAKTLHVIPGQPLHDGEQTSISFNASDVLTVERRHRRMLYRMPEATRIHDDEGFFSADGGMWFLENCRACEADVYQAPSIKVSSDFGGAFGSSAVFNSKGDLLLRAGVCGGPGACSFTAEIYDAHSGTLLRTLTGRSGVIKMAAFSPDDQFIVTTSEDNTAKVWVTETGALIETLIGHTAEVIDAAFSSNGRSLITTSRDGTARVWDAGTGVSRLKIRTDKKPVINAAFADGGSAIVTISKDGGAQRWNARNGSALIGSSQDPSQPAVDLDRVARVETLIKKMQTDGIVVTKSLASANDTYLFTESDHSQDGKGDGKVRVWDISSGSKLAEIAPTAGDDSDPPKDVAIVAISRDEKLAATTEYCFTFTFCDRVVRLRETVTGADLRALRGHENFVYHAAFSPNGKTIVTSDGVGGLRLWHTATGAALAELRGHNNEASIAFSPDSSSFLAADKEGKVLVYACEACGSLDALLVRARKRMVRNLTCQEQKTYVDEGKVCQ